MDEKNNVLVKKTEAIHQIMIVDGMSLPKTMPFFFERNAKEIIDLNKNATYRLWSGDDVRNLIKNWFDKEVLETFDSLTPYAYKADLARLCVLYVHGGLYIDLGVKLMREFLLPSKKNIAVFRDLYQEDGWFMMQNGLIYSEKARPELLHAINWTVQNRLLGYYGKNSLYPTGPVQLGRAVALVAATSGPGGSQEQWIGECRSITPSDMNKNMIYTDPLGNLTAVRAKIHAGDLAHMGLRGGNNHNKLWQSRKIYGEKSAIWNSNDEQIRVVESRRHENGIVPDPKYFGNITWGPYVNLQEGNYKLKVKFDEFSEFHNLEIMICSQGGVKEHFRRVFSSNDLIDNLAECEFFLDQGSDSVEFKLYKLGEFSGALVEFQLEDVIVKKTEIIDFEENGEAGDFFVKERKLVTKEDNFSSKASFEFIKTDNLLQSINIIFSQDVLFDSVKISIKGYQENAENFGISHEIALSDLRKTNDDSLCISTNYHPRKSDNISIVLEFSNFNRGSIDSIYISAPVKSKS